MKSINRPEDDLVKDRNLEVNNDWGVNYWSKTLNNQYKALNTFIKCFSLKLSDSYI